MKRGKALLAIFSVGLLLTACGNPSEKGVEYLEKGEYDQAVEQFEQRTKNILTDHQIPAIHIV